MRCFIVQAEIARECDVDSLRKVCDALTVAPPLEIAVAEHTLGARMVKTGGGSSIKQGISSQIPIIHVFLDCWCQRKLSTSSFD